MRENKGITLIALVVTIIVLLILAGVSISMLMGENGIITQAQESKIETRGGAVEEARDLWKVNQKSDEYTNSDTSQTLDELLTELEDKDLLTEEERNEVEETGKVTIGSREIVFFETINNFEEYMLMLDLDTEIPTSLTIRLLTPGITNVINKFYTDEEVFMLATNSDMTFPEYIENEYMQGNINTIYTNLKDYMLAEGGMSKEEYKQFINNFKMQFVEITNPNGTKYNYDGYEIPIEIGEYIFSIKLGSIKYNLKINIDEHEIINDSNRIYVYDIKNKKLINIVGGKAINMDNEETYQLENYLQKDENGYTYVNGNQFMKTIYDTFKIKLLYNETTINGFVGCLEL